MLGCPFHQPERVLEALAIDPERRHQHEILTDVDAVDLHHHDVERGQVRTHPFLHARSRQRHEVPRSRRLRHSGPRRRRNIALGKPHRTAEFPRRDVDQHQVHRPLAEPVLRDRTVPARKRQLLPSKVAHARPLDCYLAGMKSKLALGSAPAVSTPSLAPGVTSPTGLLSVLLHHRPKRIDARGQAEPIEACRHLVPSFAHSPHIRRGQCSRCCANSLHGVAFLSWNQHPKPTGLRRATSLLLFQHSAGQCPAGLAIPLTSASALPNRSPTWFHWRVSTMREPISLSLRYRERADECRRLAAMAAPSEICNHY